MEIDEWESIRQLLIFMDGRVLLGYPHYLNDIKNLIFEQLDTSSYILQRMLENTLKVKKGLGLFGQFLVERYGDYAEAINLKETAFFPYAVRLLSIKKK